jgi:ribosomal protein S18 acetylase RimI-like enzyme
MNIRRATQEDLDIIQKLNQKLCKRENHEFDATVKQNFPLTEDDLEYIKKSIKGDGKLCLVVEDDNTLIGYLIASIEPAGSYRNIEKVSELDSFWVEPDYRNNGLGKKLVNEFKKWSLDQGVDRIRVNVSTQNVGAIKFYKREGFEDYDSILEANIN